MPIQNLQTNIFAVPKFGIDASALRVITIPLDNARAGTRIDLTGTFLYCIAASSKTVNIGVAFHDQIQDVVPYKEGQFISGVRYSQIYVTNTAQPGGYVTLLYGVESQRGLRIQNPASQFDNVSIIKESVISTIADVTILIGLTIQIAPANAVRKSLLITNLMANLNNIRVGDVNTGNARGVELAPGMTVTFDTTAAIYGYCTATQNVGIVSIED